MIYCMYCSWHIIVTLFPDRSSPGFKGTAVPFWGAKRPPAHTQQPPPPLAWQAKPGRYFFQKRHLAPWPAHKQLCWQPGLAGVCRVFRLLPLLTLSHRHDVLSPRLGPSCPHPSRGRGDLRAGESFAPCLSTEFDAGEPPGLQLLPT